MRNTFFKGICLILVSVLLVSVFAVSAAETAEEPAAAEAAVEETAAEEPAADPAPDLQYEMTKEFVECLAANDLAYTYDGIENNLEFIHVSCESSFFEDYYCYICFDKENTMVSIRFWNFLEVTADKNTVLDALNKLNAEKSFAKFVYDEANSAIRVESDVYVGTGPCSDNVLFTLLCGYFVIENEEVANQLLALK